MFQTRILEVISSNLGWEIGSPDWDFSLFSSGYPWTCRDNTSIIPRQLRSKSDPVLATKSIATYPAGNSAVWCRLPFQSHVITCTDGREQRRLRFLIPFIYLDRREMKRQEGGENCITRRFITCTLRQV
jgi:hypothetical protein